ncbi:hypothetical protein C369_06841 [Cryptococcus neoformans A5-35-17]|nr:hypothetical protein C369_06841 [Cryptococcus neoformans var. grubii A5-35-17]
MFLESGGLISCVMPFSSLRMFWILAFT